ncbi:AGO2 [Drosophila simulans]|uniref:AGO2 n=1 Tax=Drosophila simulans TaxID=7240 RepID=B4QL34_DROSI|nr:AGO2 [Drosophila simulans]
MGRKNDKYKKGGQESAAAPEPQQQQPQQQQRQQQPLQQQQQNQQGLEQQPSTSSGGGQKQKFQGWTGQKTQGQARDGSGYQQQGQWRPAQGQQRGQQQGQEGGYQQRPPAQQQGGHQQGPQGWPAQGQKGGYQQGGQRQYGGYQQGQGGYQTQSQGQYQSRGPPQQQPSTSSGGGQKQKFQGWAGQKTQGQARDGSVDQQQGQWRPAQGPQRGQQQGQEGGYQQRPPAQQQGGHQQGPQGRPAQGQKGGYQQGQGGYQTQSQGQYQSRGPPQQQQAAPLPLPPQPEGSIKRGTIGRPGQVAINYLDLDMSKMPSVAYHYDVKIMPERPTKFYRQAFEQFRMDQLGGAILAFDGKASCYSVDKLPLNTQNPEVTVTDRNGRTLRYTIEIKETADSNIDLKSLTTYMKDRIFDKPMRAMQCLEVVLASPCYKKSIRVGRSFFKMSDPGESYDLKDGYEALVGLYQAFMLGDRPFLNVDISHKSFPMPIPMIQYLEEFSLNGKINNTTNLEYSRRFLEPFLRGINVVYTPPKSFQSAPRVYRVNGLSRAPANSEVFEHDGKKVTIASYFHSRNYPLKYPQLHCLNVGSSVKSVMLPIELCSIEEGQALNVGCTPKICCVIVVKRHHTRFFPSGVETPSNRFNNVDPGTVVDRTIVHPNEMQFFMVSHQAIQGTAKPTRYNVIENTGNLDIDLLQQLTYNLCHMFPRCNRSVSYPAPAYLAHLVAARGRVYLTGTHRFLDLKKEYAKRTIVPEFMKKNPMYFV